LSRIKVYALGGTIAMVEGQHGVVPGLTGQSLVAAIPDLTKVAHVEAETLSTVASPNITVDAVLDLADRVRSDAAASLADGFVITQGTDTIEETAFLLDILLSDFGCPVIITGAMRHPLLVSPDGPGNILTAVRAAASAAVRQSARELGVLVALNDTIYAASAVLKMNSHRLDAFGSPSSGSLGTVVEDRTVLFALPNRAPVLAAGRALEGRSLAQPAPVAFLATTIGDTGWLLQQLAAGLDGGHHRGVVIAAMGGGHVPERLVPAISEIARRIPIVMASRTGSGPLLLATYGFAGAEMDLRERGVISAGYLHPYKAAALLELLLRAALSNGEITTVFAEFNQ
jgi:L-asparaginase